MRWLWALLFLGVPVGGVSCFLYAYRVGWWSPENVSTFGGRIDDLFNLILAITGATFVLTEGTLVYFLFRYGGKEEGRAAFVHGNHRLEAVWTLIPATILLFIVFAQMGVWKRVKFRSHFPTSDLFAEVTAAQFEWRIRYAGPDGQLGTADDLRATNFLHVPAGRDILIRLRSADVLHSFFLPHLRLKQDAVPGMAIPVWFNATRPGAYDLVCAELCGWGHYKMRGELRVVSTPADFDAWYDTAIAEQERTQ